MHTHRAKLYLADDRRLTPRLRPSAGDHLIDSRLLVHPLLARVRALGEHSAAADPRTQKVAAQTGVPIYLVMFVVLIEDKRFWSHFGTDPIAIARACYMNARRRGRLQGGSTIPEQLIKMRTNLYGRSVTNRLRRSLAAMLSVANSTKVGLLCEYLETVYFGRDAYGATDAARMYFSKPATALTRAESFFLAERIALPNAVRRGRIRNLLFRDAIRALLWPSLARLPQVYGMTFGPSTEKDVAEEIRPWLGESHAG